MSECTQCYKDEPTSDNVGMVREMVDKSVIAKKLERLEQIINDATVDARKYKEDTVGQLFNTFNVDLGPTHVCDDDELADRVGLPVEEVTHYREVNGISDALNRARANVWDMKRIAERFVSAYLRAKGDLDENNYLLRKQVEDIDETKAELDNLRKKLMDAEEKLKECRGCNAFLDRELDCYRRQVFDMDTKLNICLWFGLPIAAGLGAGIVAILKHFFG